MAQALRERRVRFVVGSSTSKHVIAERSLADLGVTADVESTVAAAMRVGRSGDAVVRARLADRARLGEIDVALERSFDPRPLFALLAPLKEDLDVVPVAAPHSPSSASFARLPRRTRSRSTFRSRLSQPP